MAIFNKQYTLTGTAQQISVDSFKNQRVYYTLVPDTLATNAYIGSSTVNTTSNAGYTLSNVANATTYPSASVDVPMGEKLFAVGAGKLNVTVVPMVR